VFHGNHTQCSKVTGGDHTRTDTNTVVYHKVSSLVLYHPIFSVYEEFITKLLHNLLYVFCLYVVPVNSICM
jgi:hypothetical protein